LTGYTKVTFLIKITKIPNIKFQTNRNDPNSKFETNDAPAFVPDSIMIGGQRFTNGYGTPAVNVLVIGY